MEIKNHGAAYVIYADKDRCVSISRKEMMELIRYFREMEWRWNFDKLIEDIGDNFCFTHHTTDELIELCMEETRKRWEHFDLEGPEYEDIMWEVAEDAGMTEDEEEDE
jgi:hypothetical protein